jgi:hypothetical protein
MTFPKSAIALVSLLWFGANAATAQEPTTFHEVFKAQGFNANTFVEGVSVNGIGNAMFLEVFQDPATGDTSLFFRLISWPNGFDNRTEYFVAGAIPSADFVIAPDLSSATLNTTINTSPGQFDNAELGPISGLVINLTWSPDSAGHLVVTLRFTERIPGTTIGHWETFHQNGPRAFGPMTGTFGDFTLQSLGELNKNRSIVIVRDIH